MLEFLTLVGLSEATKALVKEVLGPLTKEALKDFYKDFLKDSASTVLLEKMPKLLKKAIAHSQQDFLDLFAEELEYCGRPAALIKHEFAKPLKQFLADSGVRAFLGAAFDFEVNRLDRDFLRLRWEDLALIALPNEFDWENLTKNYLRKVKGFIRQDAELARQLELEAQVRIQANTAELLGVQVDFDLKAYQESLKERYGRLSLDSLDSTGATYNDLRLWKIFEPQDVRECAEFAPQMYELPKELKAAGEIEELLSLEAVEQRRRSYAEQPVESVRGVVGLKEAASQARTVILGDPGSGKSTLLQAVALEWAEQSVGLMAGALRRKPLPILIELRLYAQDKDGGKCNSFLEYLHQGNNFCHLNQLELDKLLKSGEVVALFDGVDEVFAPKLREAVVNDIHRFSNQYPQVQMVVTSRWLGYKAETLRNADFRHYMLQDLNDEQIGNFVEKWHGLTFGAGQAEERVRKQGRLQKAIAESKPIQELAGNPLLLTMMAILNRNQELPRDRARLYERASEVLLYQWDVKRKVHEVPELKNWQIDVRDKQAMLRKVAHHMQADEQGLSGNVISRGDLEQILIDYLKTLEVDQARPVARIMIEQLRERNFILCYLGADNYAFVHRTFLEYFCASELVWQFEKKRTLEKEDLKALYGAHFQEEAWDEVLRLMAGMVGPRFVGEIIEYLLEIPIDISDFIYRDEEDLSSYLHLDGLRNLLLSSDCFFEVGTYQSEISEQGLKIFNNLKREIESDSSSYSTYSYYLTSDAANVLTGALAKNWRNEKTLTFLKSCSTQRYLHGSYSKIPSASIHSIGRFWKDSPTILPWLKSQARNGFSPSVCNAAVQTIANNWKDEPDTLGWLKEIALDDVSASMTAVYSVATVWKDEPDTLDWLKSVAESSRRSNRAATAAVHAVTKGWKTEPETLPWLKKIAKTNKISFLVNPPIKMISKEWREDPETFSWLKDCAQSAISEEVRCQAIQEIATSWKENSETFPILQRCLQKEHDSSVRCEAVKHLAQRWKDNPDTLSILRKHAQSDEDGEVRCMAIKSLFEAYSDDSLTLSILKRTTQFDPDPNVRRTSLERLVLRWKSALTITILQDCARNDADGTVRYSALKRLLANWPNDLATLSILKYLIKTDAESSVRSESIRGLSENWSDEPDTVLILRHSAKNDADGKVRHSALKGLLINWSDDLATLSILKDLIKNDTDQHVRSEAVRGLVKNWHEELDTFLLVKDCIQCDQSSIVRRSAMLATFKARGNNLDTQTMLESCAQFDEDVENRCWGMRKLKLFQSQNNKLELLDFWCARSLQDPFEREDDWQENPRQIALTALVQQYPTHPKTTELLQDRSQNDNDEKLRDWATQQLTRLQASS
ncbi:MAG: HEAT repeat domain-containing protein [Phormidesmis sp.]